MFGKWWNLVKKNNLLPAGKKHQSYRSRLQYLRKIKKTLYVKKTQKAT